MVEGEETCPRQKKREKGFSEGWGGGVVKAAANGDVRKGARRCAGPARNRCSRSPTRPARQM